MRKHICITFVVLSAAGSLLNAQPEQQAVLLEKSAALVDREGKQAIPAALELIEKAIALDPSSERPYTAAGRLLMLDYELNKKQESLARARDYADRAVKANPHSADARTCRAQVLLDMKAESEAVLELKQALKDEPGNVDANLTYLACLVKFGRRQEAGTFANESLGRIDGTLKGAVAKTYGRVLLNAGFYEEALAAFEKAIGDKPTSDPEILRGCAFAFAKLGRFPGAANVYRQAYLAEPRNKELLVHISICYEKAGDLVQAADFLRQYVSEMPADVGALKKLAGLYDRLGDTESAAKIRVRLQAAEGRPAK